METETKYNPLFLEIHSDERSVITYRWERNPLKGVDEFEHNMTLLDCLADLEAKAFKDTAKKVEKWEAGKTAFSVLESIPQHSRTFLRNDKLNDDYVLAILGE